MWDARGSLEQAVPYGHSLQTQYHVCLCVSQGESDFYTKEENFFSYLVCLYYINIYIYNYIYIIFLVLSRFLGREESTKLH